MGNCVQQKREATMFSKLALCLASGLVSLASCSVLTYPLHASCKLDWTFSESCTDVFSKIEDQINLWDVEICPVTAADCDKLPCGQLCLYKLTGSTEATEITATHTTPVSKWGMRDIITYIPTCAVQVCGQPHL